MYISRLEMRGRNVSVGSKWVLVKKSLISISLSFSWLCSPLSLFGLSLTTSFFCYRCECLSLFLSLLLSVCFSLSSLSLFGFSLTTSFFCYRCECLSLSFSLSYYLCVSLSLLSLSFWSFSYYLLLSLSVCVSLPPPLSRSLVRFERVFEWTNVWEISFSKIISVLFYFAFLLSFSFFCRRVLHMQEYVVIYNDFGV